MAARARFRALPNILSLSRIVLAAAFVAFKSADARLGLVAVAGATDFLDGYVARRGKWTSRWGALIDPIADRVFALVAVSAFLFDGSLSTVGYFVMISRDLMTAVGFLVARMVSWLKPVEFKARFSGKLVTVLQLVTFAALLKFRTWVAPLLWLVGLASLYSVVDYTYALWRARAR
ncbi:MAG: CDP-alcohol phosphatidyltransferase family protein [Gemmatimonadetes bacterium]|nr:CDP-alcohol phosphatidyltransferase family protein [Gemmatimonadota bacterium]